MKYEINFGYFSKVYAENYGDSQRGHSCAVPPQYYSYENFENTSLGSKSYSFACSSPIMANPVSSKNFIPNHNEQGDEQQFGRVSK